MRTTLSKTVMKWCTWMTTLARSLTRMRTTTLTTKTKTKIRILTTRMRSRPQMLQQAKPTWPPNSSSLILAPDRLYPTQKSKMSTIFTANRTWTAKETPYRRTTWTRISRMGSRRVREEDIDLRAPKTCQQPTKHSKCKPLNFNINRCSSSNNSNKCQWVAGWTLASLRICTNSKLAILSRLWGSKPRVISTPSQCFWLPPNRREELAAKGGLELRVEKPSSTLERSSMVELQQLASPLANQWPRKLHPSSTWRSASWDRDLSCKNVNVYMTMWWSSAWLRTVWRTRIRGWGRAFKLLKAKWFEKRNLLTSSSHSKKPTLVCQLRVNLQELAAPVSTPKHIS